MLILPILTILPILSILPILLLTEDSQFNVDLCLSETGVAQPTWLTNMKFFGKMVKKREERSTSLHYWHNLLKHLKLASTIILRSLTHTQIIKEKCQNVLLFFLCESRSWNIKFAPFCADIDPHTSSHFPKKPIWAENENETKREWGNYKFSVVETIFQNLVQHAHGILKYIVSSRSREIRLRRGATCACLGYFCLCQVASLGLG